MTVVAAAGLATIPREHLEKPKRTETAATRKCRRGILQEDNIDGNEQAISSSDDYESGAVPDIQADIQACVVNGDPNLMTAGAAECTGLNISIYVRKQKLKKMMTVLAGNRTGRLVG
ncbi:unnamed protein product [Phytophthora fragariaefolia]|uniref:Unnamed protein product n=1 Tax=Phytophthora fragariaefolia TaxID=1490495 RepID=A0A9W6TTR5_9STRA|nr:unnamed protein product [Phytophthora fragariaefolia]